MADPYQWARDFASTSAQRAGQIDNDRTQMLLSMFQEEAARQRPYVTMPAELQLAEAKAQIQRRYGKKDDKEETGNIIDDIVNGGGKVTQNADGSYTAQERLPDGTLSVPFPVKKPIAEAD